MKKDIKIVIVRPFISSFREAGLTELRESLEQNYIIISEAVAKVNGFDEVIYILEKVIEEPKVESLPIGKYKEYLELELNYCQRELQDIDLNPNLYEYIKQKVNHLKIILNK